MTLRYNKKAKRFYDYRSKRFVSNSRGMKSSIARVEKEFGIAPEEIQPILEVSKRLIDQEMTDHNAVDVYGALTDAEYWDALFFKWIDEFGEDDSWGT